MDARQDDWEKLRDERLAALEAQFGAADGVVSRAPAGGLPCIGITHDELDACHADRGDDVLGALKASGVFLYTHLRRPSVAPAVGGR